MILLPPPLPPSALRRLRLGWKRLRLLDRARRKAREIVPLADRTALIRPGDILAVAVMRNEALRLSHWLAHHRRMGVDRFLIVDNGSEDGTRERLMAEPDVSLWSTAASYRASRFGMDWANALLGRFGRGHWCLTLDADELLIFPHWEERGLRGLRARMEATGQAALPCLMIEPYPDGPLGSAEPKEGDPLSALPLFDAAGFRAERQRTHGCLLIRGGPRARVLMAHDPARAPVMSKTPFLRWRRGQVYVNSTHFLLPAAPNAVWEGWPAPGIVSGVLLHTKLLPDLIPRSAEERQRGEHFTDRAAHGPYYDRIAARPDFRHAGSRRYEGWRQLEALGLLSRGGWD